MHVGNPAESRLRQPLEVTLLLFADRLVSKPGDFPDRHRVLETTFRVNDSARFVDDGSAIDPADHRAVVVDKALTLLPQTDAPLGADLVGQLVDLVVIERVKRRRALQPG